jgi:hypothetical protein
MSTDGARHEEQVRTFPRPIEDARRRELLQLFRGSGADQALQGYQAQLERLETEPGVRRQP